MFSGLVVGGHGEATREAIAYYLKTAGEISPQREIVSLSYESGVSRCQAPGGHDIPPTEFSLDNTRTPTARAVWGITDWLDSVQPLLLFLFKITKSRLQIFTGNLIYRPTFCQHLRGERYFINSSQQGPTQHNKDT